MTSVPINPKHPQICLYQPEIPQNTGAIGRLAAAATTRLHLVEPLGFTITDKAVRRAGLDYWPFLDMRIHPDFDAFLQSFGAEPPSIAFLSTKTQRPYTEIPTSTQVILFGRETSGLPPEFHSKYADHFYTVPMYTPHVRSLNLANSVAIVLHDLLARIHGYAR